MAREKKRQVCFRIEESIVKEMEETRDKTGVPVSTQIELRLKGFAITAPLRREILMKFGGCS